MTAQEIIGRLDDIAEQVAELRAELRRNDEVLRFVAAHPRCSVGEIVAAIRGRHTSIRRVLDELVLNGSIVRTQSGRARAWEHMIACPECHPLFGPCAQHGS